MLSATRPVEGDLHLAELERRDRLSEAVAEGSARLLATDSLEHELPQVLSRIAELVRIDRVLVMQETLSHEGTPSLVLNCGWAGPHAAPFDIADIQAHAARDAQYLAWLRPLHEGKVVGAIRATAVSSVRAIMTAAGSMSVLLVPIRVAGRHWGHIGIDDCHGEHDWSADEIISLQLLGGIIGAAITRERSLQEIRRRDSLLQAMTKGI